MTGRVSAVVPVLNEAARIRATVEWLAGLPGLGEVIVADGGSADATVAEAQGVPGVNVIASLSGRGPQMNAGARAASGDVLWFVHADARPPRDAVPLMLAALGDPAVVGGAFRIRTEGDGTAEWPARLLWLADVRPRYSGLPYGDQAVFVRRSVFEALGGFAPVPLFEDLDFSRRLRRAGRIRVLPAVVSVSGRRFMARPIRSATLMTVLPALYRLGVAPARLARWYGHVR